jgi:hypothetical protein
MGREAVQAVVAKMKGETIHAVIDSGTVVVLHPPNRARRPCEPANANQSQTSGVPSLTPPIVLVLVVVLVLVFRASVQTHPSTQLAFQRQRTKTEHKHEHD